MRLQEFRDRMEDRNMGGRNRDEGIEETSLVQCCYGCNGFGHRKSDCPNDDQGASSNAQVGENDGNEEGENSANSATGSTRRRRSSGVAWSGGR